MKVKKILSIVLSITMVLTIIQCMGTKKAYAVTDNEGPLITNITVTPCVANPGDTIIISARIVDESGVAEGSNNSVTAFIKTEGGVTVTRDIRLARKNGDIYDGVYECEYRIPTGYSAGNWYARIMACDIYGNDETEMPKVDFRVTDTTLIQSISRLELNLRNGISLDAFKTVLNDTHSINVGFTDCTSRIYIVKSAVSGNTIYDDFVEKYGAYDPSNRNAQNYTLTGVIDLEGLHGYNEQNVEIEINIAAASGGGGGGGGSTTKRVTSIEAVNIQIKNGTQVDEFKNNLKDRYTVLVKFSDNSSAVVPVSPGFDSMGNQYGSFYEQFIATYGEKKYNPQNRRRRNTLLQVMLI